MRSPVPVSRLAAAIATALTAANAPNPASIGLILSEDRELSELNERAMGRSEPTDVLSFPLLPPDAFPTHVGRRRRPSDASARSPTDPAGVDAAVRFALPPGRRPHLGDIVISVERAIEQAESGRGGQSGDVRWSPADELPLLAIHGALHVCGWDHAEPEEEAAMRAVEQRVLERTRGRKQ